MVDEQKLRELAMDATPGPWSAFVVGTTVAVDIGAYPSGSNPCIVHWTGFDSCGLPKKYWKKNAYFIAAANPAAILAMLDELQTLRSERTAWRVTAENAEAELTLINEMNDQLRDQNTAVDEACAQLEAAVKQARIDALEEAKQHLVKLKEQSLAAQTKDAAPMTFADDVNKNIRLATVLLAGAIDGIESLKGKT